MLLSPSLTLFADCDKAVSVGLAFAWLAEVFPWEEEEVAAPCSRRHGIWAPVEQPCPRLQSGEPCLGEAGQGLLAHRLGCKQGLPWGEDPGGGQLPPAAGAVFGPLPHCLPSRLFPRQALGKVT